MGLVRRHTLKIALIFFTGAHPTFARGLSDLAVFSKTVKEMQKTYAEPARREQYREALEAYAPKQVPERRDFDRIFNDLHTLWVKLDGMDRQLVKPAKPLEFKYTAPDRSAYSFVLVTQPLHGVWLLQNLKEDSTDVCSDRDTLLIDRWTPLLKHTRVFSVEQNGKYTGTTLTLVPIRNKMARFLLVVPSGKTEVPEPLLEAFLKDYRKKDRTPLQFALLTKIPGQRTHYQISSIDASGRKTGSLGPVNGFRLLDAQAKKIVAIAPVRCSDRINGVASAPASGGKAGEPKMIINIDATASATVNAPGGQQPAAPGNSSQTGKTGKVAQIDSNFGEAKALKPERSNESSGIQEKSPAIVNTTINNNYGTPKSGESVADKFGRVLPKGEKPPRAFTGFKTPSFASKPSTPSSVGTPSTPRDSTPMGGTPWARMPAAAAQNPGLSPSDRKIQEALDRADRALANNEPIPRPVMRDVFNGSLQAQDPAIKDRAEDTAVSTYLKNPNTLDAYRELEEVVKNTDGRQLSALRRKLRDEFCANCTNCAYCKELEKESRQ